MTYYFVPGRLFELSKAEILSVFPIYTQDFNISYNNDLVIVNTDLDEKVLSDLFNRLGGFVSWGKVIDLSEDLINFSKSDEKVVFGINLYFKGRTSYSYDKLKKLADNLKDNFKQHGKSAKYLLNKSMRIDSINIERNKILQKGFLLEIFDYNQQTLFGIALGVQNATKFAKLEYEKPFTDNKMGVLPAKLARIMVNLAQLNVSQTVWDPFCGSGTILLSSYDLGVNVIGSDIESRAVKMTQANIEWLGKEKNDSETKYNIFRMDITKPDNFVLSLLRKTEINALVCEPFMGPPLLSQVSPQKARDLLNNVKSMYLSLFKILEHSKLHNFTAVLIIPSYKTAKGWLTLSVNEIVGKKWEIKNKKLGGDLHWSRPDSIIKRNIFVLFKGN